MNRKHEVTVVVPFYAADAVSPLFGYLSECVKSVSIQTASPAHLIVVDDREFNTEPLSLPVTSLQTTVFRSGHRGVAYARSLALSQVDTEFVSFLDADDILRPQALEWMRAELEREENAVYNAVAGLSTLIDTKGVGNNWPLLYLPLVKDIPYSWFRVSCFIFTPGQALIRTDAAKRIGWDEGYGPICDWDFWLRMSYEVSILRLERIVVEWRQHPANNRVTDVELLIPLLRKMRDDKPDLIVTGID